MKKNIKFNPIKSYINYIKHTIIPKPYSHQVKMNIVIKKGQKEGTALIPCTIYAMDHSIDLNPALIRRKDKKIVKYFQPKKKLNFIEDEKIETYHIDGKNIYYNPNQFIVECTEEETNKGYKLQKVILEEFKRCNKCGQKLVLSEVKATRYRSCPSIKVKVGDKAKNETVVPVQFGFNKTDITRLYWTLPVIFLIFIWWSLNMLGINIMPSFNISFLSSTSAINTAKIINWLVFIMIWGYIVPVMIFKIYSILKWYHQVKPYVTKSPYKTNR